MLGFELRISGVGSSTNWATTTAIVAEIFDRNFKHAGFESQQPSKSKL